MGQPSMLIPGLVILFILGTAIELLAWGVRHVFPILGLTQEEAGGFVLVTVSLVYLTYWVVDHFPAYIIGRIKSRSVQRRKP